LLPGQTDDQGLQLFMGERHLMARARGWPDEASLIEPSFCQPDADAIAHQHLGTISSPVGKQMGMVRMSCAKDLDHASQCHICARSHVQRLHGQPGGHLLESL
jgi:hypothetical protein